MKVARIDIRIIHLIVALLCTSNSFAESFKDLFTEEDVKKMRLIEECATPLAEEQVGYHWGSKKSAFWERKFYNNSYFFRENALGKGTHPKQYAAGKGYYYSLSSYDSSNYGDYLTIIKVKKGSLFLNLSSSKVKKCLKEKSVNVQDAKELAPNVVLQYSDRKLKNWRVLKLQDRDSFKLIDGMNLKYDSETIKDNNKAFHANSLASYLLSKRWKSEIDVKKQVVLLDKISDKTKDSDAKKMISSCLITVPKFELNNESRDIEFGFSGKGCGVKRLIFKCSSDGYCENKEFANIVIEFDPDGKSYIFDNSDIDTLKLGKAPLERVLLEEKILANHNDDNNLSYVAKVVNVRDGKIIIKYVEGPYHDGKEYELSRIENFAFRRWSLFQFKVGEIYLTNYKVNDNYVYDKVEVLGYSVDGNTILRNLETDKVFVIGSPEKSLAYLDHSVDGFKFGEDVMTNFIGGNDRIYNRKAKIIAITRDRTFLIRYEGSNKISRNFKSKHLLHISKNEITAGDIVMTNFTDTNGYYRNIKSKVLGINSENDIALEFIEGKFEGHTIELENEDDQILFLTGRSSKLIVGDNTIVVVKDNGVETAKNGFVSGFDIDGSMIVKTLNGIDKVTDFDKELLTSKVELDNVKVGDVFLTNSLKNKRIFKSYVVGFTESNKVVVEASNNRKNLIYIADQLIPYSNEAHKKAIAENIELERKEVELKKLKEEEVKKNQKRFEEALKSEDLNIIAETIELGANVDIKDEGSNKPILIKFIANNKTEIIKVLLSSRVKLKSKKYISAIYLAVLNGNEEVAKLLIDKGAITSERFDPSLEQSETPLLRAVKDKNLSLVKLLLENGARKSVNVKSGDRLETPLLSLLRSIYENGSKPSEDTYSIVMKLIDYKADVNEVSDGKTALYYAEEVKSFFNKYSKETVRLLKQNGAVLKIN